MKSIKKPKEGLLRIWEDVYSFRIAIIIIMLYIILTKYLFDNICPFVILTGFPCAGCGLTRAVFFLCTGDFFKAIHMNLTVLVWIPFIIWFIIRRYIQGKGLKHLTIVLILICLITLIYYGYRMAVIFPSKEPMIYTNNNILSRYLNFLK
jgi:hypothetical protein